MKALQLLALLALALADPGVPATVLRVECVPAAVVQNREFRDGVLVDHLGGAACETVWVWAA